MNPLRHLPFLDLKTYKLSNVRSDLLSAITVLFLTIPQGIAYAMIAGLPPAMGLYASIVPTFLGSLTRSSRFVLAGPTNALSLLVGMALATSLTGNPYTIAITLAFMVGIFQLSAGLMGLASVVDFISRPVVLGYITGAGVLIGIGQLPNLTATEGMHGQVLSRLSFWINGLGATDLRAVAIGLATCFLVIVLRMLNRKLPGPMIALAIATALSALTDLSSLGIRIVSDLAPIPSGLPPLTMPDPQLFSELLPVAIAATVLSLVESSAVARSIASKTNQKLNISVEFAGQGLANLAAGFTGGYPVSGSLSRSVLNQQSGASSRLAGVFGALITLLALLTVGPIFNYTPIPALAGVLLIVAWDLVDKTKIRLTLKSRWSDRLTFLVTVLGTWTLPLDKAIYVGVALSIIFFLRRTRLLTSRELAFDGRNRLREYHRETTEHIASRCKNLRIVQLEGRMFYAIEGELRACLDRHTQDPAVQVLVVRLKRTQGMDISIAAVYMEKAAHLRESGRHLMLVGVRPAVMELLNQTGIAEKLGHDNLFPSQPQWFMAMNDALRRAQSLIKDHHEGPCPLATYLESLPKPVNPK